MSYSLYYCFRKINHLVPLPFAFIHWYWCTRSRVGTMRVRSSAESWERCPSAGNESGILHHRQESVDLLLKHDRVVLQPHESAVLQSGILVLFFCRRMEDEISVLLLRLENNVLQQHQSAVFHQGHENGALQLWQESVILLLEPQKSAALHRDKCCSSVGAWECCFYADHENDVLQTHKSTVLQLGHMSAVF